LLPEFQLFFWGNRRIVLDQIRTIDSTRLGKGEGIVDALTVARIKDVLKEMLMD